MSAHAEALARLRLDAGAASLLRSYLDLLGVWSERVNLTGARTAKARVALLVESVLPMIPAVDGGLAVDVGSGNGSPGLIVAALRPDVRVTLLEPRQRRWAFLSEAARLFPPGQVTAERVRHDLYRGPRAQTVLMRALTLPLSELRPLIDPRGAVLVVGRPPESDNGFVLEAASPAEDWFKYRCVPRGTDDSVSRETA